MIKIKNFFYSQFQKYAFLITKKILGNYLYAVVVKSKNGLFAIDIEDNSVGGQLRQNGQYGIEEIERLSQYITLNSKVLIVGSHIGTLAIPISTKVKEVIAIEANPNTYDLLLKNISLNSVINCQAINIAAGNRNENIDFLLNTDNSGGSKRVPKVYDPMYYYDNPQKIQVKSMILDEYLKVKSFDLIVMDIEGSEYFALKGMQEILANSKVLVVEFLPHHLKNVSGVTVEEFIAVIDPYFSKLTIPSKQKILDKSEFFSYLQGMYMNNEEDDGIIFEKE